MMSALNYNDVSSNPYHLNQNSSAIEYSSNESAGDGCLELDILSKFILIKDDHIKVNPQILQEYVIVSDSVLN